MVPEAPREKCVCFMFCNCLGQNRLKALQRWVGRVCGLINMSFVSGLSGWQVFRLSSSAQRVSSYIGEGQKTRRYLLDKNMTND